MIVILTYRRWRKIKKALRRIEDALVAIEAELEKKDKTEPDKEDDDPRPVRDKEDDEEWIDFQIRLASWERRKSVGKKNEQ